MPQDDADNSLHGFEQTIANFLHDVSGDVVAVANRAQVADLDAIRKSLTELGGTGRQAALLGEDALAEEARKQMVQTLVQFSESFEERTCWDQLFDDGLPVGQGVEYRASGDLKLIRRDNGPGNKATYTLSGEMDIELTKGDDMVTRWPSSWARTGGSGISASRRR